MSTGRYLLGFDAERVRGKPLNVNFEKEGVAFSAMALNWPVVTPISRSKMFGLVNKSSRSGHV